VVTRALLGIAAAAGLATATGVSPAEAGSGPVVRTPAGSGSAWFEQPDDHVHLCDNARDHKSVAVKLRFTHENGRYLSYWRWNWWGNGTCKILDLRVKENRAIRYMVCLGDHGAPGGKRADVIDSSCSPWGYASN
jgi:hypothetical protein